MSRDLWPAEPSGFMVEDSKLPVITTLGELVEDSSFKVLSPSHALLYPQRFPLRGLG